MPTHRHSTVLSVCGHTTLPALALGSLIGRHPRPRELEGVEGLGAGCVSSGETAVTLQDASYAAAVIGGGAATGVLR